MKNRSREEVGTLVKARRLELGITEKSLLSATGIDSKTLKGLESGERWPQEETRMKVEAQLRWAPGSIAELREGGDATALLDDDGEIPDETPLQTATTDEIFEEIRRRIEHANDGAVVGQKTMPTPTRVERNT